MLKTKVSFSNISMRKHRMNRERANLSFFIVIMFFAVFAIIVLTEVLLIDDKNKGQGPQFRRGYNNKYKYDRSEYDEQADDYIIYDKNFDSNLAAFLKESAAAQSIHTVDKTGGLKLHTSISNIESKLPSLGVNQTAKDGVWQTVSGTRSKFFVFSAFYDKRDGRTVRIIGATKTRGPDRVWCRLWYPPSSFNSTMTSFSVPAKVKMIRENWNLRYSACFVLCPLRNNLSVPSSVSIVSRLQRPPMNHMLIRNTDKDPDLINKTAGIFENMAVCVKPLHFEYNKALEILEFIETNRILGVEHFTLYNHTIGTNVSCILKKYQEEGVVTMLPWQLNMKSQKEIRTEGLFAALNDCLYRNMYRYAYVALIDLDEFIIPRHNNTLTELIRWFSLKLNTRTTASYSFQNAFFYLQWDDDTTAKKSDGLDSKLITLRKTRRKSKLHPHKQRSKYICRPEFVIEAGNHFVWEFLPGHGTLNVPPEAAILHHYRVCEFGGDECIKSANVIDRTIYRYKNKLVSNVEAKWRSLRTECGL